MESFSYSGLLGATPLLAQLWDVRSARDRLLIYRQLIEDYQKELLPLQKSILSTSQHFYNYMALSAYHLIGAKKQEIEIQINYTKILLDYWNTQVDLDRALGGNLRWVLAEARSAGTVEGGVVNASL